MLKPALLGLLITLSVLSGSAREVKAAQCLKPPAAIPGLTPDEPEWLDLNGDGFWRPELHDPRWAGGAPRGLTQQPAPLAPVADPIASARVLAKGDVVYIAVYVDEDDAPTINDEVYVGLTEGNSDNAHALRISMNCAGVTSTGTGGAPADSPLPTLLTEAGGSIKHWKSDNARSTNPIPSWDKPTTLTGIRVACWNRPVTKSPRWAVTLRLSFPATSNTEREVFVGVKVVNGNKTTILGNVAPVDPTTGAGPSGATRIPPIATIWSTYSPSAASAAACANDLELTSSNIGVWRDGAFRDTVQAGANTFRARIWNVTSNYGDWEVRAKFSISNWGSSARDGLWTDMGVDASGNPFDSFGTTNPDVPPWRWEDNGAGNSIKIDLTTTPQLRTGATRDQSLLVQLLNRRQVQPQNPYALRNMVFQNLSETTKEALISVDGLEELFPNSKEFEILLNEITRNLPPHRKTSVPLRLDAMARAHELLDNPLRFQRPMPEEGPNAGKGVKDFPEQYEFAKQQNVLAEADKKRVGTLALDNSELVPGFKVHEMLSMSERQLLEAVYPTIRLRPYYVDNRAKGEGPLMVPMPSFGLYLRHEGPQHFGFARRVFTDRDLNQDSKPDIPLDRLPGMNSWSKLTIPARGEAALKIYVSTQNSPLGHIHVGPLRVANCDRCAIQTQRFAYWPVIAVVGVLAAFRYRRARRRRG